MQKYKNRLFIVLMVVVCVFLGLIIRLVHLQLVKGDDYEKFSRQNRIRAIRELAPRGRIFDRNGSPLVVNKPSFNLKMFPREIEDVDAVSSHISAILDKDQDEIKKRIVDIKEQNSFTPVTLATNIGRDTLISFELIKHKLFGVTTEIGYLRDYPKGDMAAFVVGYLGKPDHYDIIVHSDGDGGIRGDSIVGKMGIEKSRQRALSGKTGERYQTVDALGREVKSDFFQVKFANKEVVPGSDVFLTIDSKLQEVAEDVLSDLGKVGSIIVVNVNTGELLVLASKPSFHPEDFVEGISSQKWNELLNDPSKPMLNRATQGTYPPGSIFKIIMALAGLKEKAVTLEDTVFCPGYYKLGRDTFQCWEEEGHGTKSLYSAIVESCDVFFYELGKKLGIDNISEYAKSFGFGKVNGVEVNEVSGFVPTRSWKSKLRKEEWYLGETIVTSIGQGYLTATPLQVAMVTAAVANGGSLLKPILVHKIVSNDGKEEQVFSSKVVSKLPFEDEQIKVIQDSLVGVVNDTKGTGSSARVGRNLVAGKTATSQVVSSKLRTDDPKHEDHAWFTSYYPASSPEIAVTILVEHGGSGSGVAHIARKMIKKYQRLQKASKK